MARQFQLLDLPLRVVGDDHLERAQHAHGTRRIAIQVVTDAEFEHAEIDHAVGAVGADHLAEIADGLRGVTATAKTTEGRHARVIPPIDVLLVDQLLELALAGHGIAQVEAREFVLARPGRHRQVIEEPVVQRAMTFELQGADRMGDAFDGI